MKYDLEGICQDCIYLEKIKPLFEAKDKEIDRLKTEIDYLNALREDDRKELQQRVEQLEAELNLYKDNHEHLNNQIEQLENIRKEAIEYINKNIIMNFKKVGFSKDIVAGIVVTDLLNILNKGSNNND